jgi:subtilisin family serine protease
MDRVIVVMQAPASGGQRDAYENPSGYVQSTLAADVASVQPLAAGSPIAIAEVTPNGLRLLSADPRVKRVFPDEAVAPHLADTTRVMGAIPSWATGQEGNGQIVAILDTGVQADHPFLTGRVVAEACFSSTVAAQNVTATCPGNQTEMIGAGAARPCAANGCYHGTHVAGIAAGFNGHNGPAGPRLDGVARRANIVAVQVFSQFNTAAACGAGNTTCPRSFTSDQLKALLHIKKLVEVDRMPIAAVNMSLGGGRFENYCDDTSALTQVFNELAALNVAVVVSSGNDGYTNAIGQPACIRSAVSVGSVDKAGAVAVQYSNSATMVSILAPGSTVVSSGVGNFMSLSGTSMAAPHVTGAIAVLRAAFPARPLSFILDALRNNAVQTTDPRNNLQFPRVQLDRALAALNAAAASESPVAAPPPPSPPPSLVVPDDGSRIFFR